MKYIERFIFFPEKLVIPRCSEQSRSDSGADGEDIRNDDVLDFTRGAQSIDADGAVEHYESVVKPIFILSKWNHPVT